MKITNRLSVLNSFVCLDDITGHYEPHNYVVYNPLKDTIAYRTERLFKTIKESMGIELTSAQLCELTSYEVYELNSFVEALREILYNAQKEKSKLKRK